MDNLVFSLNATVPIFLMMILGLFFNKNGWMDEEFANKTNKFVFRDPLPVWRWLYCHFSSRDKKAWIKH